jgi:hypothetical protein
VLPLVSAVVSAIITVGCTNTNAPTTNAATGFYVTGRTPPIGQSSQLTAIATFSDGTTKDVANQAAWSSSDTTVAAITSAGVLTVLQAGSANVTAVFQSLSGQFQLNLGLTTVAVTGVTTLTLCGPGGSCVGNATQLQAIATLADGAKNDVTMVATWSSSNQIVASVAGGLVTAHGVGEADISATYQTGSGAISLVVSP